jgi:cytochrome c biogenesis factor
VWIWVGMVLMAGGGILALWPTRRRTLAASEV